MVPCKIRRQIEGEFCAFEHGVEEFLSDRLQSIDEVGEFFPDDQVSTVIFVCYSLPWDDHGTAWEHLAEEVFEDV